MWVIYWFNHSFGYKSWGLSWFFSNRDWYMIYKYKCCHRVCRNIFRGLSKTYKNWKGSFLTEMYVTTFVGKTSWKNRYLSDERARAAKPRVRVRSDLVEICWTPNLSVIKATSSNYIGIVLRGKSAYFFFAYKRLQIIQLSVIKPANTIRPLRMGQFFLGCSYFFYVM